MAFESPVLANVNASAAPLGSCHPAGSGGTVAKVGVGAATQPELQTWVVVQTEHVVPQCARSVTVG